MCYIRSATVLLSLNSISDFAATPGYQDECLCATRKVKDCDNTTNHPRMKGLSERVLSEDGSRLCVSAADTRVWENLTLLTSRKGRKCIHPALDLRHHVSSSCGKSPCIHDGALVGRRRHEPHLNRATALLYSCTTGAWGTINGAFPLPLGYVYQSTLASIWLPFCGSGWRRNIGGVANTIP